MYNPFQQFYKMKITFRLSLNINKLIYKMIYSTSIRIFTDILVFVPILFNNLTIK